MSFSSGEVVLVPIPFTDLTSSKVRPAVVVGSPSQSVDLFVVPISSQLKNTELPLKDWKASGLNVACGVKAQIATIDSRIIV
jgi:mRNA interferase MazF